MNANVQLQLLQMQLYATMGSRQLVFVQDAFHLR